MKSVLITGAAGFLGRYIVREYLKRGWAVLGVDSVAPENAPLGPGARYFQMDLPSAGFAELLASEKPFACVHCAGRASVPLSLEDPVADFQANVLLTFEMLEALRKHAPQCRFLLLSSAAVYGDPATLPVSEDHVVRPLSPYGYHKHQAELLCEEYHRIYGIPTTSARIFSAYGPGLRRQVVWDICSRVLTTNRLELHGTGLESRDFIHAADIASGIYLLIEAAPCQGEVYNLASGREVTIAELANILLSALDSRVQPVFDGAASPGNPMNWRADIGRMAGLGFVPSISLEQGLQKVAAWSTAELLSPGRS